ncbi:MAG: hypothetical protein Q9209_001836 [Squamulea sp. 1 TL-2023]
MASTIPSNEKPTIGASVHPIASPDTSNLSLPTQQSPHHHNTYNNNPSTISLPTPSPNTEAETYDPTSTNPFSPFYSHARASESRSRVHIRTSTADDPLDLEKGNQTGITISAVPSTASAAPPNNNNNSQHRSQLTKCQNKQSLLCRSEAKKAQGWWRNLSKRQKVLVHVLIALLFVGAVTGLGLGVSKAMGTGIWKTDSASRPIGEES